MDASETLLCVLCLPRAAVCTERQSYCCLASSHTPPNPVLHTIAYSTENSSDEENSDEEGDKIEEEKAQLKVDLPSIDIVDAPHRYILFVRHCLFSVCSSWFCCCCISLLTHSLYRNHCVLFFAWQGRGGGVRSHNSMASRFKQFLWTCLLSGKGT